MPTLCTMARKWVVSASCHVESGSALWASHVNHSEAIIGVESHPGERKKAERNRGTHEEVKANCGGHNDKRTAEKHGPNFGAGGPILPPMSRSFLGTHHGVRLRRLYFMSAFYRDVQGKRYFCVTVAPPPAPSSPPQHRSDQRPHARQPDRLAGSKRLAIRGTDAFAPVRGFVA